VKITRIEHIDHEKPIAVYDVIDAKPNHNFCVRVGKHRIISHNCGFL
jgi:hypothetical protein